jgi:hypothetical protein
MLLSDHTAPDPIAAAGPPPGHWPRPRSNPQPYRLPAVPLSRVQPATIQIPLTLDKFPFRIEAIQTDTVRFQSAFHWHLLDRGIRHIYIKPATPRLNGKVERSHRIDGEEFYRMLKGVVIDDTALFNDKLAEWETFYNYHRPHGALGGQTPYERLRQKTTATTTPE